MKNLAHVVFLGVLITTGCATTRFYPVQGPLSAQTPPPVLVGKMTGAFNSGSMSVTLSDGEICKGPWSVVPRPDKSTSTSVAARPDLSAAWDTVYGAGFYVSHVLGAKEYARAAMTGNKGTKLDVEMYKSDSPEKSQIPAIRGVAKDDKENVYKVVVF